MRLLNVGTLHFIEFFAPNIPRYAIASHRWVAGAELLLSNFHEGKETGGYGWRKVTGFAEYVRVEIPELEWLWIDTCCIDQKSSTELSEAINSMFRWYREAEVCLAYLWDVPEVGDPRSFEKSAWFIRGWTLQELLAPEVVIFLAEDWRVIGHKGRADCGRTGLSMETGPLLDERIAAITQIPETILRDYQTSKSLSIDEKLQWMSHR